MVTLLGIRIHEFATAASDFFLFVESIALALALHAGGSGLTRLKTVRGSGSCLLLVLGISSLLGAIYHAFFSDTPESAGSLTVWLLTAASIGFVATALWYVIAGILHAKLRFTHAFAALFLTVYLGTILFVDNEYATVIKFYAPPILILGAIGFWNLFLHPARHWLYLSLGIGLSIWAAAVQALNVSLASLHLEHNALYHILQAIGLPFIFLFFRKYPAHDRPRPGREEL